ncbi:hypothetical protein HPB47_003221 [Ixodes persulcatus]|uniref:Uncharacterized protein n=1 Tax=Ixodes persulcatus TaxID=34615 RepID=A0AC60PJ03_IXOPE|nr:hypothetical protein HPB47_003221 [Ixodes persulcatus]
MAACGSQSSFSAGCGSLDLDLPSLFCSACSRCSLLQSAGLTRSLLAQRSSGPAASVSLYSGPRASQPGPTTAASSVLRKGSGPAGIPATAGTPGGDGEVPGSGSTALPSYSAPDLGWLTGVSAGTRMDCSGRYKPSQLRAQCSGILQTGVTTHFTDGSEHVEQKLALLQPDILGSTPVPTRFDPGQRSGVDPPPANDPGRTPPPPFHAPLWCGCILGRERGSSGEQNDDLRKHARSRCVVRRRCALRLVTLLRPPDYRDPDHDARSPGLVPRVSNLDYGLACWETAQRSDGIGEYGAAPPVFASREA